MSEDIREEIARVICGEPVRYGDGTIMWANKFEAAAYADALMPLVARIQADAWEQGKSAWARYEMACEDAASSGQGHIVSKPKNPWSEIPEGQNDNE